MERTTTLAALPAVVALVPAPRPPEPQDHQAEAFEDGYRRGYDAGYEIGRAHAEAEMAERWRLAHAVVQRHAARPTWAELQRIRYGGDAA